MGAKVGHFCSDVTKQKISRTITAKQLGKDRLPKHVLDLLKDKDWLFEQRITRRKSKEKIAEDLGISTIPLNKWLKVHSIPMVRYNESDAVALSFLRDKEWLIEQHTKQKQSCEQIAQQLNISKSTVSVWLEKHGIEANESNAYPRKHLSISSGHQEIVSFIQSFYSGEIISNARGIIGSLELDIFLPELKLAVEYNGVWSHLYRPEATSFALEKGRTYHVTKTDLCEQQGIDLIQIWSSSWEQQTEIWKSILRIKMGFVPQKLFARNCEVVNLDLHQCKQFLQENHLQGADRSKIKVGLMHKGELVAAMTFGTARYTKHAKTELLRFCVKQNCVVVGGFSRLWKFANPETPCISYADRMRSTGKVYLKNGFELANVNRPGYWYVKQGSEVLEHRSRFRKDTLGNNLQTEWETMRERGYSKIFDCGTLAFMHK